MPRKIRERTSTRIYHVMLRGINKQNIFFCENDYLRMMTILHDAPLDKDPATDAILSDNLCTIYAYCILDNHVHILLREGLQDISEVMKKIEIRYALYYNKRYERVGYLFQGRFESEPVNDSEYFYTLLRYIHRNPVKAKEANRPEDFPYSSWNEYLMYRVDSGNTSAIPIDRKSETSTPNDEIEQTSLSPNIFKVLKPKAIATVLKRYPLTDLIPWVNLAAPNAQYTAEDIDTADKCLDINDFPNPLSDREAFEILSELSGITNPEDFRQLDQPTQIFHLIQAIDRGITLRQASRLGSLTYYMVRKAFNQKVGDSSTAGSVLAVDKNVEILSPAHAALKRAMDRIQENDEEYKRTSSLQQAQDRIRHIEGHSKKTYHRMHLIAEYLSAHPDSKCQDIATHIEVSAERTRILLVQLSNANVIDIQGNARARTYSLHFQ